MVGQNWGIFCPIKLGTPHLEVEMWETMNFDQRVLVLFNFGC
jgi:hypothetical protein